MKYNQLSRYGAIAKSLPFTPGKIFFVLSASDSWLGDFQHQYPVDEDGVPRVYTSLSEAYDATVSGRNDVVVVDSNSSHALSSMLTVSKNRVHFVSTEWLAGARRLQDQRCRVTLTVSSGATNVALARVTGNGCSFRGIKFIQSSTVAQAITCFQDESPNGLYAENCSFHSLGSAQLTSASGSAIRMAGDGSHYFRCQIGADTLISTEAAQVIHIATINSAVAKRFLFEECEVYAWADDAGYVFVKIAANSDVDRHGTFKRCGFHATDVDAGVALTVGINSQLAGSGYVDIDHCAFFGCTDVATAAVGNTGLRIVATVPTAGTSGVAVTPTA